MFNKLTKLFSRNIIKIKKNKFDLKNKKYEDEDEKTLKKFYSDSKNFKEHPLEKLFWENKFKDLKDQGKYKEIEQIKNNHRLGEIERKEYLKNLEKNRSKENKLETKDNNLEIKQKESKDNKNWSLEDKKRFIKKINSELDINNPYKTLKTLPILLVHKIVETEHIKEIDIQKLIIFFNYFIKNKVFKRIDNIYLEKYLIEICKTKIDKLSPVILSMLANSLNKVRCKNEELWISLSIGIIKKANKFSLRSLCNILNSYIPINNKLEYSSFNNTIYKPLIPLIIAKLKIEGFNRHDLLGVFWSYGKSNNLDDNFLEFLIETTIKNFQILKTKEIAIISHITFLKKYENKEYINMIFNYFKEYQEKFKFSELMILYKFFDNYNLVDNKIFKIYHSRILNSLDLINIQDFNIINSIHLKYTEKYNIDLLNEELVKKLNECYSLLSQNFDKSNIIDMINGYSIFVNKFNNFEVRTYGRNLRNLIKIEYNKEKINYRLKQKIIENIKNKIIDKRNAKLFLNKLN